MGDHDEVKLSNRQLECLQMIAEGATSAEVASVLGLSVRTIDHYIYFACAKLGVRNRTQAVAKALNLKLISGPGRLATPSSDR